MSGPGRASLKTPSSSLSVGASARAFSDRYATLSLDARDDRPTLETSVFAGAPLGARADLTVQYTHADARDRGSRDLVSAFSSIRLTDRASLFMGVAQSWERGARPSTDAFAGLSIALGTRTTATLAYQRQSGANGGSVEVQRSLPVGPGFGYRARVDATGSSSDGLVDVQYQGPWGRYEASWERANGDSTTVLNAAGGLVAIGGTVFATRPVTDGFALIQVPGVAGVRGYVNNQEIGRTNARGDLPVPDRCRSAPRSRL